MALLPLSLSNTLRYFAKYNYPLTATELWFWQHGSTFSQVQIKNHLKHSALSLKHWSLRKHRERYSKQKWLIAKRVGESLKKFPTISAIFVTGALAMNNCPVDDDIDFMIVTTPNTLWITRAFVVLYLKLFNLRRRPKNPHHTNNKICDNLYLDSTHLVIHNHSLYTAHEILQAKCIMDRSKIHKQFLLQNRWVGEYLPVAYRHLTRAAALPLLNLGEGSRVRYLLWPLNLLFFVAQYAYMFPKKTTERVNLHYAFFHPTPRP